MEDSLIAIGSGTVPVRVEAVAARWTPDAVGIVFKVGDVEHRCWVWSGAVDEK